MKPTATQQIEQAVNKAFLEKTVNSDDALRLILAERARLKRGVKKLRGVEYSGVIGTHMTVAYHHALDDILKLWEA